MKLKPSLAVCLFSIATAFSLDAAAASDTLTDAKPDAEQEQTGTMKKMKPHSHMEEKLGVVVNAKDATPNKPKPKPAQDKSKHFHPRDGGKL